MTTQELVLYVLFPVAGYLLGSIPFAFVIGKMRGVDIRTVGSKNIGATNLGRTLGKRYFWQAFLLDAAKGFVPVLAATFVRAHFNSPMFPLWTPLLTAVTCVVGHLFPLWLKFKGGKGVATGFGVVLGFWPHYTIPGVLAGLFFIFVLMVYRYISLASMTAAVAFACLVGFLGTWHNRWIDLTVDRRELGPIVGVAALFAGMIVLRHRANIVRLMNGVEPQIGQKQIDKAKMDK